MAEKSKKTLTNTDVKGAKKQVKDLETFGDGDTFKLICKASSAKEGWMKSTKAMEISSGCVVQVTTQQGNNIAEALTFVPGVRIHEVYGADGICIGRFLTPNGAVAAKVPFITKETILVPVTSFFAKVKAFFKK